MDPGMAADWHAPNYVSGGHTVDGLFQGQAMSPVATSVRWSRLRFSQGPIKATAWLVLSAGFLQAQNRLPAVAVHQPQSVLVGFAGALILAIVLAVILLVQPYICSKILNSGDREYPSVFEMMVWWFRGPPLYAPGEKRLDNNFDKSVERTVRRAITAVLRRLALAPEFAARWDARLLLDRVQLKTRWEGGAFSQDGAVASLGVSDGMDSQNRRYETRYRESLSKALAEQATKRGLNVSVQVSRRSESSGSLEEIADAPHPRQYQFLLRHDPGSGRTTVYLRILGNPLQTDPSWKKLRGKILLWSLAILTAAAILGILQWKHVIDILSWFERLSSAARIDGVSAAGIHDESAMPSFSPAFNLVSMTDVWQWVPLQKILWAAITIICAFIDAVGIEFLKKSVAEIGVRTRDGSSFWEAVFGVVQQREELRFRGENLKALDSHVIWAVLKKKTVVDIERRLRRKLGHRERDYLATRLEYLSRPAPIRGMLIAFPSILFFSFLTVKGIAHFDASGSMAIVKTIVTVGMFWFTFWLMDKNRHLKFDYRVRGWHILLGLSVIASWDFGLYVPILLGIAKLWHWLIAAHRGGHAALLGYTAIGWLQRPPAKDDPRRSRDAGGRFTFERGGSPDDVLKTVYAKYRDVWILPSVYHAEIAPDVLLNTTKTDFKANHDKGFMDRQPNPLANQEYEYQLTALGIAAAEALDDLDLSTKMSAAQRADLFRTFFVLAAPPPFFSRRGFRTLFVDCPAQEEAAEKIRRIYQFDKPRFQQLLHEWTERQNTEDLRMIQTRMLEKQQDVENALEEPSREALGAALNRLEQGLSSIDRLRRPENTIHKDLADIEFKNWDLDTPNANQKYGDLIEMILGAYGFKNAGSSSYELHSLTDSSWEHEPPPSVSILVDSRFPSSSYELELARKRLRRVHNEVIDSSLLQAAISDLNMDGVSSAEAAQRVLEAFGYKVNSHGSVSWTVPRIPRIVAELPEVLLAYRTAKQFREQKQQENKVTFEMLATTLAFLQSALRNRPAELLAPAGKHQGFGSLPALRTASATLAQYAGMADEERQTLVSELLVERAHLRRWAFLTRRRIDRLLVELMTIEFGQERQAGTAGRAIVLGQLSPKLAAAILQRLSRFTMDDVIFTILGDPHQLALQAFREQMEKAAELARSYQHQMELMKPGGAVESLPATDEQELRRLENDWRGKTQLGQAG